MKCPTCPESVLVMSDRAGVEVDYCPSCRGVWLDRGELDKIIERSASTETRQPSPSNPDDRRSGDRDKYDSKYHEPRGGDHPRKKKSYLGDLFDF